MKMRALGLCNPMYGFHKKNIPFPATMVIDNMNNGLHCISDQFDVILMGQKCAFLSKTRKCLSDPKLLNGSVYCIYLSFSFSPSLCIS